MTTVHRVQQGECINSIAYEAGFYPDTVWNAGENKALREQRKDMNVLLPGDTVTIPDKRERIETKPVDKHHRFRRRGVPKILRIQFLDPDEPIANASFTFVVDGVERKGSTDGQGWLTQPIAPNAKEAVVRFEDHGDYEFQLGGVDPANEQTGVEGRLRTLGYYDEELDGAGDEGMRNAVTRFQRDNGLDDTGKIDATLQSKLKEMLGC
jgi:N-acetylmuramoyl-L-alanine amidase